MRDIEKGNLRKAGSWLSGEVEIRLPKAWLAIGGLVVLALLVVALD